MKLGFEPRHFDSSHCSESVILRRSVGGVIKETGPELESYRSFKGAAAAAASLQSCPTPCDPIDGSLLGFSVPGILQARTLEWVAISFSNA